MAGPAGEGAILRHLMHENLGVPVGSRVGGQGVAVNVLAHHNREALAVAAVAGSGAGSSSDLVS